MKAMDENLRGEVIRWQEKLFSRSVRRQSRLRCLRRLLGNTAHQRCLEISAGDGLLSARLRESGGAWTTMAVTPAARDSLAFVLQEEIRMPEEGRMDVPDQSFDTVILTDVLERIRDDHAFIKECHRVLKTDGRLVIATARKPLLCFGSCPLRALLGLSWKARGLERPGYSAAGFFDVLKDGFDVPETVSFSTCCVEAPGLIGEALANRLLRGPYNMPGPETGTGEFYHYTKLHAIGSAFYPLMWLLARLDELLLLIVQGHNLAAKSKRRLWRARRTPVLIDGRSIAEAAINTKIGTAAPF